MPPLAPITNSCLTFSSCDKDCHKDVVVRHYGVLREDFHRRQFTLDALAGALTVMIDAISQHAMIPPVLTK